MKLLYVGHAFGNVFRGGAEIQMEKTAKEINNIQKDIEINIYNKDCTINQIKKYEIIHFFKSNEYYLELAKFVKKLNKKVVISPIYLPNSMDTYTQLKVKSAFKISKLVPEQLSIQKRIINLWNLSDRIYPNTYDELEFIKSIIKNEKKFKKIHNATENIQDYLNVKTVCTTLRKYGIDHLHKQYILNVARIEPRKNQLKLINIAKKNNWPLVIVGAIGNKDYYDQCIEVIKGSPNIIILDGIYDRGDLANLYYSSKVFCLPSTMETPGLAALEACSIGTNSIITSLGGTKEYFGDYVSYINPFNDQEIENTINLKINEDWNKNNIMSEFIVRNYSYKNIAEKYIEEYKKLLI
ncbi:glycogen synthase [Clostridium homopropionicum DSM 5847]|uniref:Glycogen synthase n=1 Tax=Clostridium homopropionicum DSM 5847 TaxID=1121318 RepID=A0A0L6ZC68_9CLOT|nr:glycosyltransferase [Clostridium homopropionicum]KOA20579.1 glycogen synthase [Clostridium homopropionicum DSM 5847]SFF93954.1 Glycosyltransferase involved in cell wall bisynthesis [Clostridium homopropionicum]